MFTLLLSLLLAAPLQATHQEDPFRTGLLALQQGDLTTARTSLEAAIKATPNSGRIRIALAQTLWKLHEANRADEAAAKALQLSPGDPIVLQSAAIFYTESGQPLKAAEAQADYAAKVPAGRERAAELYFAAAQPLLQKEAFAEALAILQPAHKKLGKHPQIELALGVAYYGLRRFNEAARAFLNTIEIAPELEQPYLFLSRFLDQIAPLLPEVTQRFTAFELAHPNDPRGYLMHAKALNAQSLDPEAAQTLLDKSLALNDHDASTHFELGTLLDRLQHFEDAAAHYEKAAALDTADPAIHYRLARDYDRLGKHDAAQTERDRHQALLEKQESIR